MYGRNGMVFGGCALCLFLFLQVSCKGKGQPPDESSSESRAGRDSVPPDSPEPAVAQAPAWLYQKPQWWTNLSPEARADVQRADKMLGDAYGLWREDRLGSAEENIANALAIYRRVLTDEHWKTWDCARELCFIQTEREDPVWQEFAKMGVRHLRDITSRLENISVDRDVRFRKASEQRGAVREICGLLHEAVGAKYPLLSDCYLQWCLGTIALHEKKYAEAQEHYEQAIQRQEALCPFDDPFVVMLRYRLALVLLAVACETENQLKETALERAREQITASLRAFDKSVWPSYAYRFDKFWEDAFHLLWRIEDMANRLGRAKAAARMAASMCESLEKLKPNLAERLLDYVVACNRVADDSTAMACLEKIRTDLPQALKDEGINGRFLREMGFAYLRREEFAQACEECRKALDRPGLDTSDPKQCWQERYLYGVALTRLGKYDQAAELLRLASRGATQEHNQALCQLFEMRAKVFKFAKEGNRAELGKLIPRIQELTDLEDAAECRRYRLLAHIAAFLERNEQARDWSTRACEYYRKGHFESSSGDLDLAYWQEHESPYQLAAICARRMGDRVSALERLEDHSGQLLASLLTPPSSVDHWSAIYEKLELEGEDRPVTETSPSSKPADEPERQSLSAIMDALLEDDATAIVGWLDDIPEPGRPALPEHWAFVIRRPRDGDPGITFERIPFTEPTCQPEDVIKAGSTKSGDWMEVAYKLYRQRFARVMPYLGEIKRLYVLSRGLMLGVPVEMLPVEDPASGDSPKLLGDLFTIAYGPSCSVLAELKTLPTPRLPDPQRILAIGDPASTADRLPGARATVTAVCTHFADPTPLTGDDATETAVYRMSDGDSPHGFLESCAYILFAGHAYADPMSPRRCRLQMAGEPAVMPLAVLLQPDLRYDDGTLDFGEIMGLNINARLVVLSACETGVGRKLQSEGYLGLPHAFFRAGARAMITTMWRVPDYSSAILIDRFFSNLRGTGASTKKMSQAEALREAKNYLRVFSWNDVVDWGKKHGVPELAGLARSSKLAYDHPFHWAGYILIGPHN